MSRQDDNSALADLDEIIALVDDPEFQDGLRQMIVRGRFDPGRRQMQDTSGESSTAYSDPTGEDATRSNRWIGDTVGKIVRGLDENLRRIRILVEWMADQSDPDVTKRVQKTIPDCLACGDPCYGRILSGFDEKCYKRWIRLGRPDRQKFITFIRTREHVENVSTASDLRCPLENVAIGYDDSRGANTRVKENDDG